MRDNISYSEKYNDEEFEYRYVPRICGCFHLNQPFEIDEVLTNNCCRHVILPREIAARMPKGRLMSEDEWRALGVTQSRGWVHYSIHRVRHSNVLCSLKTFNANKCNTLA